MRRMVVVGAGILGTCHAWMARAAGWDVVLVDRHTEPRGATVRNFGLVWVSGRASGDELAAALRARTLWEEIAAAAPGCGFRPDGSLTLVTRAEELSVIEEVAARPDAASRGFTVLDAAGVRARNPALRGSFVAGLHCSVDAVVEPRAVLPAMRAHLESGGRFAFAGGVHVAQVEPGRVRASDGRRFDGDCVVVCCGAESGSPVGELVSGAPLRRCRLQMMQTAPLGERLATSLADADSLRYYPAFATPALAALPPQHGVAARLAMQLLVSQRAGGELTIGDSHDYEEPFAFDLDEEAYGHMAQRAESLLGRPLPPVMRRWAGVYSQVTDGSLCWRDQPAPGIRIVTGPGGRGMTLAPALAEATIAQLEEE